MAVNLSHGMTPLSSRAVTGRQFCRKGPTLRVAEGNPQEGFEDWGWNFGFDLCWKENFQCSTWSPAWCALGDSQWIYGNNMGGSIKWAELWLTEWHNKTHLNSIGKSDVEQYTDMSLFKIKKLFIASKSSEQRKCRSKKSFKLKNTHTKKPTPKPGSERKVWWLI